MNTELATAWAAVPGIIELTAATQKLRTLAVTSTDAGANLAEQLANDLLAGGDLPDPAELGQRATAARQEALDRQAAKQVLTEASMHLNSRLQTARQAGAVEALNHLVDRLADVLAQVSELAPKLGAIRNRDAAWAAADDIQDAWRELEKLSRTHDQIRQAQVEITATMTSGIRTPQGGSVSTTQVAQKGVLDLQGLPQIGNYRDAHDVQGYAAGRNQPWPAVEFGKTYGPEYLLWLNHTTDARPWIPTSEQQIVDAYARHIRAQQASDNANANFAATF